jgi:hypothetical protein
MMEISILIQAQLRYLGLRDFGREIPAGNLARYSVLGRKPTIKKEFLIPSLNPDLPLPSSDG